MAVVTRLVACWLRNLADHIDPPRRPHIQFAPIHVADRDALSRYCRERDPKDTARLLRR
ncbi:hypothetical protein [Nocardia africana]|uniref:Uncharacterized protein n=1 Tax=Nocardia africana TaxID=134964 RepID=A0A378X0T4_9NOCA|nr:hypothetical protein [Nocardia africana]MCC3311506.1 hypothetical protein [Nocardia africana]SUA47230.1 Uncharacterised protein [Nocardia africana]